MGGCWGLWGACVGPLGLVLDLPSCRPLPLAIPTCCPSRLVAPLQHRRVSALRATPRALPATVAIEPCRGWRQLSLGEPARCSPLPCLLRRRLSADYGLTSCDVFFCKSRSLSYALVVISVVLATVHPCFLMFLEISLHFRTFADFSRHVSIGSEFSHALLAIL